MSSNGGRPGSLPIRWPASTRSPRTAPSARSLGEDVAIEIDAFDEMNISIPIERIARRIKQPGHDGLVCLVGVQSNQFPRAMAIAREFRARASRSRSAASTSRACSSMLKELTPELKEAVDLGITLFAGEAEEHFESLPAGRPRRQRQADLQLHGRPAESARRRPSPTCRGELVAALRRHPLVFRRRPRLPVPVLVLHHHQRAGPQVALARRRRHRAHRARERQAGHLPLLHHRRQFRPQPQLGGDLRPADRAARAQGLQACISSSRSTRSPTRSRTSSRRRRAPAAGTPSSGSRASIRRTSSI